jgi:hypothetical protein
VFSTRSAPICYKQDKLGARDSKELVGTCACVVKDGVYLSIFTEQMTYHIQELLNWLCLFFENIVLRVLLTPTCHVSGYPRQVINVDAS